MRQVTTYTQEDRRRLEKICTYRKAGLSLKRIAHLLDTKGSQWVQALEQRLGELNEEIAGLREQQQFILGILGPGVDPSEWQVMNKRTWVALLRASGFSDREMDQWHAIFERQAPEKHQAFLSFLGISDAEIDQIRRNARESSEER